MTSPSEEGSVHKQALLFAQDHETEGSGERGAGPTRVHSGGMKASVDSQSRVLEAKLDSLMAEVTDLVYNMGKISETVKAFGFAGQFEGSSSNYSQTSILKTKLESLMSEVRNLASDMENISVSVGAYNESINKISNSLPTLKSRVLMLESSVVRLQDDRAVQGLENRFSSLEKSLDKLKHHKLPDIETKVNVSLNDLRNQFLPSLESRLNLLESSENSNLQAIESRLNTLESSQNELHLSALESIESRLSTMESSQKQTSAELGNRLKVLETSLKKLQDQQYLPVIEARINSLNSSFEERQDKVKAEARKDVQELAKVVDVLCNENLSDKEAKTVKDVAERFGMKNTVNKLSSFIRNTLTLITCIQVFKQELGHTLITRRNAAFKMILQNFSTVSQTGVDFCELSLDELRCFLYSSELRATAEQMFNAISKWVVKDRLSRTSMASLLLPAVQFSRCSLTFLRRIRNDILVQAHSTVQQSVEETIKKVGDVLFVLGGDGSNGIIETLNKFKSSWIEQNNIFNGSSKRTHAFPAAHRILVLEEENKRFRSFDTLTKEWNDLRPLPVFRDWMSVAMEGNELFVLGGGSRHESRCDVYDSYQDAWTQVTSLNVGRCLPASSSLQGKIYCCGGYGSGQYLSSMEVFDQKYRTMGWTSRTSMSVGRSGHCLLSFGQYFWAVGGWDGKNRLTDLERFDPSTNTWTKMASMHSGRFALTTCFFEGRLYAIGGWNYTNLNTVELYDPDVNRWIIGAPLNKSRSSHASCVVREMPNAVEYQWFK